MFGGTSPYRFGYTDMMKQHLERFDEVKQVAYLLLNAYILLVTLLIFQVPDLWTFLLEDWVPALYNEDW